MINTFENRKRTMDRYCYMPKYATTILLAFAGFCSFGQKTDPNAEKTIKRLLPDLRYIPAKSFTSLAYKGRDSVAAYGSRITSVHGFYISQTEVTNKEYREFVHYVRDSIAHSLLQHFRSGNNSIDWAQKIDWNDSRLDAMMTAPEERIFGKKEIDPAKLNFDIDFFGQKETISIYPDTLVWIRDFSYSYNEPLVKKYFSHSSYNNYPVLGVSLKQAMAFCEWKTEQLHSGLVVRLPLNAEWESAAMGEKNKAADLTMNKPYRCNFGSMAGPKGAVKGNKDDGFFYTGPVKSFPAEDYGLYDMKGNVAEWTSTALDEIMNVEVKPEKQKRLFIVKGGGWNSSVFYLQPGVCQFYNADAANTWTGFRYVVSAPTKK